MDIFVQVLEYRACVIHYLLTRPTAMQTPVTVMLIGQAEEVLCPQGNTTLQRHPEGEGEGDGLLYMSLPQSPLLFSSHYIPSHCPLFLLAILAHCTDCTIYITLHYPHTH